MIPANRLRFPPPGPLPRFIKEGSDRVLSAPPDPMRQLRFWRRLALVMTLNAIILGCLWYHECKQHERFKNMADYVLEHPFDFAVP